jgi:hypothetical protein
MKAANGTNQRMLKLHTPTDGKLARELEAARSESKRLKDLAYAQEELERLSEGQRAFFSGSARVEKAKEDLDKLLKRDKAEGHQRTQTAFHQLHHATRHVPPTVASQVLLVDSKRHSAPRSKETLTGLRFMHLPACATLLEVGAGVEELIEEVTTPRDLAKLGGGEVTVHELEAAGEVVADVRSKGLATLLLKHAEKNGFVPMVFAGEARDDQIRRAREEVERLGKETDVPLRKTKRTIWKAEVTKTWDVPINKMKDFAKQQLDLLEEEVRVYYPGQTSRNMGGLLLSY